MMAYTCSSAR